LKPYDTNKFIGVYTMHIKKPSLWSTALILILVLTACNSSSNQAASTTSASGTNSAQGTTSLSEVNKLLVGTLRLEDTDQAVSAEEAAQLLPLWQAYRALSNSDTAAEAEVDALIKQIQSTLTSGQIQAIEAMNLTSQDMVDLMQAAGGPMARGTPNPQSTPGFEILGGVFPQGGPPAGEGGGPPSGSTGGFQGGGIMPGGGVVIQGPGAGGDTMMIQGTPDPSMQATAQARFSTQASQVNTILLDVLIQQLQEKAGSS
jgi:hypothetical protein